jgi:hypothetical protein
MTTEPWAQYVFFTAGGNCDFTGVHPVAASDGDFLYWILKPSPELPPSDIVFRCIAPSLAGYVRDVLPLYMTSAQQSRLLLPPQFSRAMVGRCGSGESVDYDSAVHPWPITLAPNESVVPVKYCNAASY